MLHPRDCVHFKPTCAYSIDHFSVHTKLWRNIYENPNLRSHTLSVHFATSRDTLSALRAEPHVTPNWALCMCARTRARAPFGGVVPAGEVKCPTKRSRCSSVVRVDNFSFVLECSRWRLTFNFFFGQSSWSRSHNVLYFTWHRYERIFNVTFLKSTLCFCISALGCRSCAFPRWHMHVSRFLLLRKGFCCLCDLYNFVWFVQPPAHWKPFEKHCHQRWDACTWDCLSWCDKSEDLFQLAVRIMHESLRRYDSLFQTQCTDHLCFTWRSWRTRAQLSLNCNGRRQCGKDSSLIWTFYFGRYEPYTYKRSQRGYMYRYHMPDIGTHLQFRMTSFSAGSKMFSLAWTHSATYIFLGCVKTTSQHVSEWVIMNFNIVSCRFPYLLSCMCVCCAENTYILKLAYEHWSFREHPKAAIDRTHRMFLCLVPKTSSHSSEVQHIYYM